MAYQNLGNIAWGSSPNITGSIAYDYRRNGSDMQYKVKITINSVSGASYFGYPIYASIRLDGTAKVSGHQIKAASPSQWSSALVYETGWLTVSGKSSGNTSLSVNIYSGSGESRDYTYSYSLYVVPAASTMTVPAITLGSAATLTITPAASGLGYTHTITYRFGSATGTITSKTSNTSVSWTPPLSLASQIPNAASGTGTLTLDTYSGSTKIGSRDYTFTAAVPASVKPTVSSVALSDEAGYLATFSAYVQGKSRLKLNATASQAYGSPIKSYTFIVDGKTTAATSNEATVDLLSAGTIPVIVRVTDGRGRVSTDYSTTITVLPYAAPQITAMTAVRCKSNGTPDPTGTYVKVVFSGAISSLNNRNSAVWKLGHKKPTDEYWTDTTVTVSQKYAPDNISELISGVAANSPYIFRISATDTVTGTVTSVEIPVPSGYAFLRTNANMDGLSFGKEEVKDNTLCVAWDMEVDGDLSVGGKTLLDLVYPVGAVYLSVNATDPSTLFGGTWERIKDTFLLAAGDTYEAGGTGGEATHKLTIDEIPSHSHVTGISTSYSNYPPQTNTSGGTTGWRTVAYELNNPTRWSDYGRGGDAAHNNMPPYLAVFVWKRTA